MMNRALLLLLHVITVSCVVASGKVILTMKNNITRSFDDIEANFGEFSLLRFALKLRFFSCWEEQSL